MFCSACRKHVLHASIACARPLSLQGPSRFSPPSSHLVSLSRPRRLLPRTRSPASPASVRFHPLTTRTTFLYAPRSITTQIPCRARKPRTVLPIIFPHSACTQRSWWCVLILFMCQSLTHALLPSLPPILVCASQLSQSILPIDFVIVGGSISGLSAAIALTRIGHKVTVIDIDDPFKPVSFFFALSMPERRHDAPATISRHPMMLAFDCPRTRPRCIIDGGWRRS